MTKRPSTDVPLYRTLPVSLSDDYDFNALSNDAIALWLALRLALPPTGVGVVSPSLLCDRLKCDRARLEELLVEMERPRPERSLGWLVRDQKHLIWLVDTLSQEYNLFANNPKHVPYIRRLVAGVNPSSPVMVAFRSYYAEWFRGYEIPIRKGIDTVSHTVPDTVSDRVSGTDSHRVSGTVSDTVGDTNAVAVAVALSVPLKSGTTPERLEPAAQGGEPSTAKQPALAALAIKATAKPLSQIAANAAMRNAGLLTQTRNLVLANYTQSGSTDERRGDVVAQILGMMSKRGIVFEGQRIYGQSATRIERKARDIQKQKPPLANPDRAIVVLLQKIADHGDGSAPGAVQQRTDDVSIANDDAVQAKKIERATVWLAEDPAREATLERMVKANAPERSMKGPLALQAKAATRNIFMLRMHAEYLADQRAINDVTAGNGSRPERPGAESRPPPKPTPPPRHR